MGKGCRYRPVNRAAYAANYDRIFGAKPQKEVKNEDEEGRKGVSAHEEEVQGQMDQGSQKREVSADQKGSII